MTERAAPQQGSRAEPGPLLVIDSVSKWYGTEADGDYVLAVDGFSLSVGRGEFVSLVGPSGCGKSTVLEIIAGLRKPSAGAVYLDGQRLREPHPAVGVVFQEDSVFPWRTVLDNVTFGLEMRGVPPAQRRERARRILEFMGLGDFADRYPYQLSGGMRQRVAIARTLVLEPEVLLLDEPLGALDAQTRLVMVDEVLRIWRETGTTVLLVTHSLEEAALCSDRVVVMTARPGRIKHVVETGLPRDRSSRLLGSEQFAQISQAIWEPLREESMKALERR
ncbi:MAG: ABC transporter ATP-binding protein [Limnochordales bacterium]|nr:ABC transporter ATP-binding protein [Limnochordales bacterium]